jgi:hypothetical protein
MAAGGCGSSFEARREERRAPQDGGGGCGKRHGTNFPVTHCEPDAAQVRRKRSEYQGMTMADRGGLKFVGFIFATVTLAVMLTAAMVVKGHADGAYTLDGTSFASR